MREVHALNAPTRLIMETTILVTALVITNALWFAFHIMTHAQHMRAYQWMIGYRPINTTIPVSYRDAPVLLPSNFVPRTTQADAASPESIIGTVSK